MSLHDDVGTSAEELSPEEGRRLLDAAARQHLGMSAEEFIEAWDGGFFAEQDTLPVQRVAMLLPFGR